MDTLGRLLGDHPFFRGVGSPHLGVLETCARNVTFNEGEYLFREGAPADWFYLLREGKVALQAYAPGRGPATIDTLLEGDVAGWSWVVEPYRAHFDARALTHVRAFALDAVCLRKKCAEDHELGYLMLARVLQLVESRLQATRLQLLDFYGNAR